MGLHRVHERVRDGFATKSSQEFARNRESSREFARVRESSRDTCSSRHRETVLEGYADGYTSYGFTCIRRIRGLTQIRERIHSGFTRFLIRYPQFTTVNPRLWHLLLVIIIASVRDSYHLTGIIILYTSPSVSCLQRDKAIIILLNKN